MGGSMKAQQKTQLPSQVGRICEEVRKGQRGAQNGFATNTGGLKQNQANNNGSRYQQNCVRNIGRRRQQQQQHPQQPQLQLGEYMQCQMTKILDAFNGHGLRNTRPENATTMDEWGENVTSKEGE